MSAHEVGVARVCDSSDVATTRRWRIEASAFAEFLAAQGVPVADLIVESHDGDTCISFDGSTTSARCTQGALVVETTKYERNPK